MTSKENELPPWEGEALGLDEQVEFTVKVKEKMAEKAATEQQKKLQEELFCQLYVKYGGDGRRALSESGIPHEKSTINYHLAMLMQKQSVQDRIAALREFLAVQHNLSEQHVVGMLLKTYEAAMNSSKFDAAEKCATRLGEYLGMFKNQNGAIKPAMEIDDTKVKKDIERYSKAAGLEIKTKGNA
jgi:hypothetical protein